MKLRFLYPVIFLLLSFFVAQGAFAQSADQRIQQLEAKIQELQNVLLEIKTEMAKGKSDKMMKGVVRTNGKEDITISTTGGGLKVESDNGNSFQFSGRLMYDYDSFDSIFADEDKSKSESQDEAEWRRTRLTAKGTVAKDWEYKFTLNINDQDESSDVNTAYIKYKGFKPLAITVGKFKEPFGLERLTSSKWITTIERSLISDALSGNLGSGEPRTGGVMLSGYHKEMMHFKWAIGAFDDGIEDEDGEDNYAITGRLAMTPMWDKNHFMHLGIAYSTRDYDGDDKLGKLDEVDFEDELDALKKSIRERSRSRLGVHTAAERLTYGETEVPDDAEQWGFEAAYVTGPLSLQGEYVNLQVDGEKIVGVDTNNNNNNDMATTGDSDDYDADIWYIQAAYTLTGEPRGYKTKSGVFDKIKPNNKYGAWELVARYEDADFDDDSYDKDHEIEKYILGVNWYANKNVKFSANYINVEVDGPQVDDDDKEDDGDAFSLRAQYVW